MTSRRTLFGLGLLLLTLLLPRAALVDRGTGLVVLADEGKNESGKGGDDGDKENKDDDTKDKADDKGKDEGDGSTGQVDRTAAYRVDVTCAFDPATNRTTCTFAGQAPPKAKDVSHVDLPAREVCTEVVGGDHEFVNPDPNTRVVGYKSRGSQGTFTLVLTGRVTTSGTVTYWVKTGDGVFPATGPGLHCGATTPPDRITATREPPVPPEGTGTTAAEMQITLEVTTVPATGAILVQASTCGAAPEDPASFDWYGACQPGGDGVPFTLSVKEGRQFSDAGDGATDAAGRLSFEGLAPGTYRLRGSDLVWCHAESDVVDAQGDLIVAAGRHVSVWVFLCGEDAVKEASPPGHKANLLVWTIGR
ncbi:MAG: prealbumin-like fold domain-containing protein [Chloroflexota bacterium]|nr:prealbumin-like fold domain-containing protein [Chloroflexota bacterium]MDP9471792.1 prealbumin-like fold domain-containing protein [Chloroflexota bacterium]